MLFSSVSFLFMYLPLALVGNTLLPGKLRLPFLFLISLVFYGWGEPSIVLLMVLSVLLSHLAALGMEKWPGRKKAILLVSVAVQLMMLGWFKYASAVIPGLRVALPAGISFYTFQAIGYNVDVYRGDVPADRSFLRFGTFISFFPQLIAGPIERYGDIAPQLSAPKITWDNMAEGTRVFSIGLSKKLLLANAAGQMWEALKTSPASNGTLGNWAAILAFAFQIYFDFSGYSDMARGLGLMMGVRLRENFNYPYTANSVTDFWRRWHMSLSTWFRDYVYIPLGGNRKGLPRQILNILIVWGLTGLRHGASWNFQVRGVYDAHLLVLVNVALQLLSRQLPKALAFLPHVAALFFMLVGWAIFAFTDFTQMADFLKGLFSSSPADGMALAYARDYTPLFIVCALASLPWKIKLPMLVKDLALCGLFVLCVAALVSQGFNPFLYFRF